MKRFLNVFNCPFLIMALSGPKSNINVQLYESINTLSAHHWAERLVWAVTQHSDIRCQRLDSHSRLLLTARAVLGMSYNISGLLLYLLIRLG